MATPYVQPTNFTSHNLLSAAPTSSMKLSKSDKDIPLGINAKGSLIELAHKLKWAYKHFGDKHSLANEDSSEENELHHGKISTHVGPWLNRAREGEMVYNPNEYVIQGTYNEGRPHPLLAYGQAFFQSAVQGEPCNYTSLGTVHSFNGSRPKTSSNGLVPFPTSSSITASKHDNSATHHEAITHYSNIEMEDASGSGDVQEQDMDLSDNYKEATEQPAEFKDEELGQFVSDNWHTLNLKPSLNGVVGPSLWSLLTSTKEVRDLEYQKLLQTFKLNSEQKKSDQGDEKDSASDSSEEEVDTKEEVAGGVDNVTVDADVKCSGDADPITAVRDHLTEPLSEVEVATVTACAVDFVVRNKVPMRILSQLYAMQAKHRRAQQTRANSPVNKEASSSSMASDSCLRKYHCPNCSYQTDNKSHLRRHISSVHFIGMPYYCYICSKEFPRSEKVKAHFNKEHPQVVYDHRLVRKDKFFGVDYSPENTVNESQKPVEDSSPGESATVKLTPKNMRTAPSLTPNRSPFKTLGESPVQNFLPSSCSSDSSFSSPSQTSPKAGTSLLRPVWKSALKTDGERRFYCPTCPYTGKDIWHLKRHYNDVHQQRKDLKCPLCAYSTGRKHRLVTHMKNHGQLFCFHCEFSTEDIITFQSHVKVCAMSQRRTQHQCTRCNRACSNRKQLQEHQYREHAVVLFCCEKCMFYSEDHAEYEQHIQQHIDRQEDGYVCQVCNQVLQDYRALRQHLATHKEPPTLSNLGGSPTKSPIVNPNVDKQDECPLCDFKTQDVQAMRDHRVTHDTEKLTCDVSGCDFETAWPLSLEHHKKIKHLASPSSLEKSAVTAAAAAIQKPPGKGTFVCPVCKDNRPPFRYKRSFEKHMAQHKQDEERCPFCPQVFYFRASLKDHLKQDHQARVVEVSSSDDSDSSSDEDDSDCEDVVIDRQTSGGNQLRRSRSGRILKPPNQGAAMEAYGPDAILHGSMAPFL